MTPTALLNDLKNRKYKPVYLFHGEEPYYIDLFGNFIENNLLSEGERGFNQTVFYGRDTDIISVLNAAKRYPMMSDYQLVLVKEAQDLKWGKDDDDKKAPDPLLSYLEKPVPTTILVFCYKHAKFDKRKKTYKAIEKSGLVYETATIYESKVAAWVEEFIKDKAYRIQPRAATMLAEYLGNDLSKIANELEKLMLNIAKGHEISVDDVQNNIGISKEYNVFELQDAFAKRDVVKANKIIAYFASNPKNNPIQMVLGALQSWFTKLLKYHYVGDKTPSNLAKELGVNPYFVKDYDLAAKAFNAWKVMEVISYLREYDLKTKGVDSTGNANEGDLLKELVFKIMH